MELYIITEIIIETSQEYFHCGNLRNLNELSRSSRVIETRSKSSSRRSKKFSRPECTMFSERVNAALQESAGLPGNSMETHRNRSELLHGRAEIAVVKREERTKRGERRWEARIEKFAGRK